MFDALFIASVFGGIAQAVKEAFEPEVPAENWANKELYRKDIIDGIPIEQRMKNLRNGKYKINKVYPKPHRDPVDGKIVIENCRLYDEDLRNYNAVQVSEWVKQGKYNLSPEEFEKEKERIKAKYERLYNL